MIKVILTLSFFLILFSCFKSNKNRAELTYNQSGSSIDQAFIDTGKSKEKALQEWTFNNKKIYLFSSKKTDDFYNYGYLKLDNIESGKFIRIAKEDSPYTGFEKIVVKYPYFTIEQAYREGDFTNYEYVTFKEENQHIYLYKYAVDYTSTQNLEENIPELRLERKTIGKVEIENVTSDFLYLLRSKN